MTNEKPKLYKTKYHGQTVYVYQEEHTDDKGINHCVGSFKDYKPRFKTYGEIAEFIAKSGLIKTKNNKLPTAEQIFEAIPNGEIFMLDVWCNMADELNKKKDNGNNS